jgi:murein DD-endopeptidase MepM/ murein hydrolase activator NlpD
MSSKKSSNVRLKKFLYVYTTVACLISVVVLCYFLLPEKFNVFSTLRFNLASNQQKENQKRILEQAGASSKVEEIPKESIANTVIVTFKQGTTNEQKDEYLKKIGVSTISDIEKLNAVVVKVEGSDASKLPKDDILEESEPDYFVGAAESAEFPSSYPTVEEDNNPNDPLFKDQWALEAIHVADTWKKIPSDASNVIVGVVDSGVCLNHPDLEGKILEGYDFIENDSVAQDEFDHGCGVAGIIAANINNGSGIAGIAPNAKILPVRVLDKNGLGTYSNVAAGIVWAVDHGAKVINLSLGGFSDSNLLKSAVDYAIEKKVILVAAVGNTGNDTILYPAKYEDVISVGSVGKEKEGDLYLASSFSGFSPTIDFWAPGQEVLSLSKENEFRPFTGTSISTPMITAEFVNEFVKGIELSAHLGVEAIDTRLIQNALDNIPQNIEDKLNAQSVTQLCWPTDGYIGYYIYGTNGSHNGIDIWTNKVAGNPGDLGNSVYPVYDGYAYSFGTGIQIKHSDNLYTNYWHLSNIPQNVLSGMNVNKDTFIGYQNYDAAVHLHLTVSTVAHNAAGFEGGGTDPTPYYSELLNGRSLLSGASNAVSAFEVRTTHSECKGSNTVSIFRDTESKTLSSSFQVAANDTIKKSFQETNGRIFIADFNNDGEDDIVEYTATGLWRFLFNNGGSFEFSFGSGTDIPFVGNFGGSGGTDVGVYNSTTKIAQISTNIEQSGRGYMKIENYGVSNAELFVGDFFGTDFDDLALLDNTGKWYFIYNIEMGAGSMGSYEKSGWGSLNSKFIIGDYYGSNKDDIGIYIDTQAKFIFSYNNESGGVYAEVNDFGGTGNIPITGNWNGQNKDDFGVYDPTTHTWALSVDNVNVKYVYDFGKTDDVIYIGDFDGDRSDDIAVYRGGKDFYISTQKRVMKMITNFGGIGGIALPGDFDGDGKSDFVIYNPSESKWFVSEDDGGYQEVSNLGGIEKQPLVGDFNGDERSDYAVYDPSIGKFAQVIIVNGTSTRQEFTFGRGSRAFVGDFDGDKVSDFATLDETQQSTWQFKTSNLGTFSFSNFSGEQIIMGDYNGDGKDDILAFGNNTWTITEAKPAGRAFWSKTFGSSNDIAVASDLNNDGYIEIGVFNQSTGTWSMTNIFDAYYQLVEFGRPGDLPLSNNQLAYQKALRADGSPYFVTNRNPSDLVLSSSSISENQVIGSVVSNLNSVDPDSGNTFTYSLVAGIGSTDNSSFTITGDQLKVGSIFDYETKNSYLIRIRTTDQGGLYLEKAFTITVTDVPENSAPSSITLSINKIAENKPVGTTVGTMSSIDVDSGETFTYTLVSGTGSTDNGSFSISGNTLKTTKKFNYEVKNSYSIRVRTTDSKGLYFEKVFKISVTNVNEVPTKVTTPTPANGATNILTTTLLKWAASKDPEGSAIKYDVYLGTSATALKRVSLNQTTLTFKPTLKSKTKYFWRIDAKDNKGLVTKGSVWSFTTK